MVEYNKPFFFLSFAPQNKALLIAITMLSLLELRKLLHSRPELSGFEEETAKIIIRELDETKPDEIYTQVAGFGIIAVYKGNPEKPSVMLRADMDALPVDEENEITYKSERKGIAHVCGHDGHMTIMIGVARKVSKEREQFGDVILLFQPAEETGVGALATLKDDAFRNINPQYVFALHSIPGFELNQIVVRKGVFNSASVGITVHLVGRTSHASLPERGISPAKALAELIQFTEALPLIQSFKDYTLTTVIHAQLGEIAFGTSPGKAVFRATLRAFINDDLEKLKEHIEEKIRQLATKYTLKTSVTYNDHFPANVNDTEATGFVLKAAKTLNLNVIQPKIAFRWSEDFAHFSHEFQSALFGIGSGFEQSELHSNNFDFPDELVDTGIKMFEQILRNVN
jgi:amidohydrolase